MLDTALKRLWKEEKGMTMGLVVIMIVLIGVMGAGLLTFVQRDLENVVEVNRGQKAIEVSDAGIQAAKRRLLIRAQPFKYNDPLTATFPEDATAIGANDEWAFNSGASPCGALPAGPGKCITTSEGSVRVQIRYLPPGTRSDRRFAPEELPAGLTGFPNGRRYFGVEADGVFNGARRKVQAILVAEDLGIPKAYFATRDIDFAGTADATDVSFFARGNITGIRCNTIAGVDNAYGDWRTDPATNAPNRYNAIERVGKSPESNARAAGVAAQGSITYAPGGAGCGGGFATQQKNNPAETTDRYRKLDFDNDSSSPVAGPKFCVSGVSGCPTWANPSDQPNTAITYPFNPNKNIDQDFLISVAQEQGNYVTMAGGSTASPNVDESNFNQQVNDPLASVYVVEFTGSQKGRLTYQASTCLSGIILVINGDFETNPGGGAGGCFRGIVSVQRKTPLLATEVLTYKDTGSFDLDGFVNIDGKMDLAGSVSPNLGADVLNMPGFHSVEVWSWRECYNANCT